METKQVTLKEIPVGGKAKVLKITGSGAVKKHIMDMGVMEGPRIYATGLGFCRVAGHGDCHQLPQEISKNGLGK